MQPQASTIKPLHVVIEFFLVEYYMCSCLLFFYMHLHNPVAAQTDALNIFLESWWFLGERAISQLPVEMSFTAASTPFCNTRKFHHNKILLETRFSFIF
jgi:hypothetical protein